MPPANDTCLAQLNGSITSFSANRRQLTVSSTTAALAPYVGKPGLTVTASKAGSPSQTRDVSTVNSAAHQINVSAPFLILSTSGWSFTINVPTFPTCIPVQPVFTPPVVFDNVFWDNRAGSYDGGFVHGIGLPGDSQGVRHWDLAAYGVAAGNALKPVKNDIQDLTGHTNYNNRGNVSVNPMVQSAYDTTVRLAPFRGDPHFVGGTIVAVDVPPTRMGNYKLSLTSPTGAAGVIDNGVRCVRVTATDHVAAPLCDAQAHTKLVQLEAYDIDDDVRPQGPAYDMGSDEYLAATAASVALRLIAQRPVVTATVKPSRAAPPGRSLVGGKAPESITSACKTCTATLQYRRGKHGKARSLRMRYSKGKFTVRTRKLAPGTYRYRVVIRNRQTHRVHSSAWRTFVISKHRKGTR
jgi:hypothetical protein